MRYDYHCTCKSKFSWVNIHFYTVHVASNKSGMTTEIIICLPFWYFFVQHVINNDEDGKELWKKILNICLFFNLLFYLVFSAFLLSRCALFWDICNNHFSTCVNVTKRTLYMCIYILAWKFTFWWIAHFKKGIVM